MKQAILLLSAFFIILSCTKTNEELSITTIENEDTISESSSLTSKSRDGGVLNTPLLHSLEVALGTGEFVSNYTEGLIGQPISFYFLTDIEPTTLSKEQFTIQRSYDRGRTWEDYKIQYWLSQPLNNDDKGYVIAQNDRYSGRVGFTMFRVIDKRTGLYRTNEVFVNFAEVKIGG